MQLKSTFFAFLFLFLGNFLPLFAQTVESDWASERKKVAYKNYWTSLQWLPGNYSDLQNDLKTRIHFEANKPNDSLLICRQFISVDGIETAKLVHFQVEKRGDFVFLMYFLTPEKPIQFRVASKEGATFIFEPTEAVDFPTQIVISREAKDAFKMVVKGKELADARSKSNLFKQKDDSKESIKPTTVKKG
jgi:hypothetical protein